MPEVYCCIWGPGAGKSTLLDILAARKSCGKVTGQVLMNGRPCGILFRRISAYVAQEDVFVPTMTAWETLSFHATLTLPKAINHDERTKRIVDVLQIMGLSRCRNTQVPHPHGRPAGRLFSLYCSWLVRLRTPGCNVMKIFPVKCHWE
jgi:ABC-type multidrug transport system ATPase subunit